MKSTLNLTAVISWFLGLCILSLGILNLIQIHPVPGLVLIFISLFFCPPVGDLSKRKLGFSIPFPVLVILALVIFWFTLGVSDLGELYGF